MVFPNGSEIKQQYDYSLQTFGEPSAMMSLLVSIDEEFDNNTNILTPDNLNTILEIHQSIYSPKQEDSKRDKDPFQGIEYQEVCIKLYPSSPICLSDYANIYAVVFGGNPLLWNDQQSLLATLNSNPSADLFLGGIETTDASSSISGATMISFVYELQPYTIDEDRPLTSYLSDYSGKDEVYQFMKYWNEYWFDHKDDYLQSDGLQIYYINDRGLDDEIMRVMLGDLGIFALAFGLMMAYFIFALGRLDCVHTRLWLAFSIGLVLLCAIVSGFGIGLYIEGQLSLIVMLIPYVLLGVGVDDMVIIVHAYDEAKKRHKKNILAHSLQDSGVAITLTSLCSCVALFSGVIFGGIPPAITTFCLMGGLSFFTNFLMQFLVFVPLLLWDERRKESKRNCICCCLQYGDDEDDVCVLVDLECAENGGGDKLCGSLMVKLLHFRPVRWLIVVVFLVAAFVSVSNVNNIDTASKWSEMVPDDSNIIEYYDALAVGFNDQSIVELQIIIQDTDFSNNGKRYSVLRFIQDIENQTQFIAQNNWLQPFIDWLSIAYQIDVSTLNSNQFYDYLQEFAHNDTAVHSDIVYKENSFGNITEIEATRFYMFAFQDNNGAIQWEEYNEWNDLLQSYGINGYVFHSGYGFAYISAVIVQLIAGNMVMAAIGVFIVLLFAADVRMAFFILIVVVLIDVDLIGCIYFFGFSLNVTTYSILVMSVGITVDYVIHISFAMLEAMEKLKEQKRSSNEETKDEATPASKEEEQAPIRLEFDEILQLAMSSMGTSVMKGAFTSLLGGLPLLLSNSQGFRTFAVMWIAIIVIAVLHAFLFVPAVFAEFYKIHLYIYHPKPQHNPPIPLEAVQKLQQQPQEFEPYNEPHHRYDEYEEAAETQGQNASTVNLKATVEHEMTTRVVEEEEDQQEQKSEETTGAEAIGDAESINVVVGFRGKKMQYRLHKDVIAWNDDTFTKLRNAAERHFSLNATSTFTEFSIYNEANEVELEDVQDLKNEFEANPKVPFRVNVQIKQAMSMDFDEMADTLNAIQDPEDDHSMQL